MNKKDIIRKTKDEAIKILAVSFGFIGASLLLSIGITLCISENWIGVFPIIVGYELVRYVILFIFKMQWRDYNE